MRPGCIVPIQIVGLHVVALVAGCKMIFEGIFNHEIFQGLFPDSECLKPVSH